MGQTGQSYARRTAQKQHKVGRSWNIKKPRKTKKNQDEKTTLEKFSVVAIAEQIGAVGVESARSVPAFALDSVLDVSGKVQKVVRREGLCRLVK